MKHIQLATRYLLVATLVLMVVGSVAAVDRPRIVSGNAVSYCQTALPVFDGNVRKRPLAIQNEGPGDAFVTCAFAAQRTALSFVEIYLGNTGADPALVSCTGVTGANRGDKEYASKSLLVTPATQSTGQDFIIWTASDFSGGYPSMPGGGLFGVSCRLPSGTGIEDSNVSFLENVGD